MFILRPLNWCGVLVYIYVPVKLFLCEYNCTGKSQIDDKSDV